MLKTHLSRVPTSLTVSQSMSSVHCTVPIVTLALLLRLINCRFIIIFFYPRYQCSRGRFEKIIIIIMRRNIDSR